MSSLSFELCLPPLFFVIVLLLLSLLFPLFYAFIGLYFASFLLHVLPVFYTVIILPIIIIIIIYVLRGKVLAETKIENVDTNLHRFVLQDTSWIVRCGEKCIKS
jgi:hypothetical protein